MEVCLSTLGIALPMAFQGRRKLVLKESYAPPRAEEGDHNLALCHRDSLLVLFERSVSMTSPPKLVGERDDDNDDDTASTQSVTTSSEGEEDSTSPASCRVSFAEPMVTEVRYRPYTTKLEKYYMFYDEHDYSDFKIAFLTGRQRNRKVSFSRELVSDVHVFKPAAKEEHGLLFYTELELQRFLDEFVSSLHQRFNKS